MVLKKLLICCAFILAICVINIHAQEKNQNNYFNFGGVFLLMVSDGGASVGTGAAVSWYNPSLFTDWLGIGTHINVLAPFVHNGLVKENDMNVGIVVSLLAGPTFLVFERGSFTLPVTAGFHFDYVQTFGSQFNNGQNLWGINMGIGVTADAVYQIGRIWNIYGRILAVYNFGGGGEFLLMPSIGAGIKF